MIIQQSYRSKPATREEWEGKGHFTTSALVAGSEGDLKPTCVYFGRYHPSLWNSTSQPDTETWKHESVVGEKRERSSVNMYVSISYRRRKRPYTV